MMSTKGANFECCMCGDTGLSYELFRCKVCQFRSQHRYCSNLYPKAESYRVCNWCLIMKEENAGNTSNSSNSSSPYKDTKSAKKKSTDQHKMISATTPTTTPTSKSSQPISPIKKPRSSPESGRKRVGGGGGEEAEAERLIRRTRSEEMANESATREPRHVFRNKVRRYKLLEEVSS